jgi:MSHA biogenesis protein MshM
MRACVCRQRLGAMMIKSTFGLTKEPFYRSDVALLPQQAEAMEMIKIHAQHGGFSVIVGNPGVGKSVIREHLEQMGKERDTVVVSFTQTMHTYQPILKLLAQSLQLSAAQHEMEKELVLAAYRHVQSQKTLYIVIDEAHLLDVGILRKLRLLFERFPKKHNLVLLGHPELMFRLSMLCNEDIKSRISYSKQVLPLHDDDLTKFIIAELAAVGLGANTFDEAALQVILRAVHGNLRLCRNLCYASLVATCLDHQRICTVSHVNSALQQPHWRSHEALLKQQVKPQRVPS